MQEQVLKLEQRLSAVQELVKELEQRNEQLSRSNQALEDRASRAGARHAERLLALSAGLNEAVTVDAVAEVIFREGMAAVNADAGSLALVRPGANGKLEFELVRAGGFSRTLLEQYQRFPLTAGRPLSDAILTQKPILIPSQAASQYPTLTDVGYEAFAGVPVIHAGQPLAGISFSYSVPQAFDEHTHTFLATLGELCAQALERARLYDMEWRRLRQTSFLAESTRLLAASLDYQTTLSSLAHTAVPELGDWCAVDIITDPTTGEWPPRIKRLAAVHLDESHRALGLSLASRFPTDWTRTTGMPQVLREGVAQFIPVITDEMLVAGATSPDHLDILRQLHFSSLIIVPLIARGLTLGALSLSMSTSGRHYDEDDLALAKELARRAAVAVDNARLFREAEAALQAAERARVAATMANQAKSTFLAMMSHEIRTPINAVIGYTDLLQLQISGPLTDGQQQQLGRIQNSARHLLGLVEEVLDLAKVEAGTLHVEIGEARSGDVVDAALGLVRALAAAKGVILVAEGTGDCTAMYAGDEGRVRQILCNLLGNAVKFTNPKGTVSIQCAITQTPPMNTRLIRGKSYVIFEILDTGTGIAPDQTERIFEPFVQAQVDEHSPYIREQGGAGLGLSISRRLAHLMGGEITVHSRLGEGSAFTLWVPAVEARHA